MQVNLQPVVHIIFKSHLDVGFTDSAKAVVDRYFNVLFPQAIETADELRQCGGEERLVWTTGSWLIYEYLEQANSENRKKLENAIISGDITWHALPFTTHTELMDPALFKFGLSLSQILDKRFGHKTIAAKMTDVPGHTRAMVPYLAEAGVKFLHIGVNPVCSPPQVPPLFHWCSPGGAEVVVMYQTGGYGDVQAIPGGKDVLAFAHQGDNAGPPTADAVITRYKHLKEQFPEHQVIASTMDAFAANIDDISDILPVITDEIGDTWIHGAGTDPAKVAAYRALCRLHTEWEQAERVSLDDPSYRAFCSKLLLVPEHTWGMDEKTHLPADEPLPSGQLFNKDKRYRSVDFNSAKKTPIFKKFADSWVEQREYITDALKSLNSISTLKSEAEKVINELVPCRPDCNDYTDSDGLIDTNHFKVKIDSNTGALQSLIVKSTEKELADVNHQLGLLQYQTFNEDDYAQYMKEYLINMDVNFSPEWTNSAWAKHDFNKPGINKAGAKSGMVKPVMTWTGCKKTDKDSELLIKVEFPIWCSDEYGAPREIYITYTFSNENPTMAIKVQWFNKPACRLPEALWYSFLPKIENPNKWMMDKMGEWISPSEVIEGGNRTLHAVQSGLRCPIKHGELMIETLDAPLVAPGSPQLLHFDKTLPDLSGGMHFNLYNNTWGSNFPMWYNDDALFRFNIKVLK
jgi:hypothetical protein